MSDDSRALVESLRLAAAYPHSVSRIELLETHISWVLLTGDFAYKLKKPVDLGFVNFSTLERRRFFCGEELRLNRRLAPEMYLEVLPISGSPQAPQVGGSGLAIEYCVKMRQFDQDALLSRIIASGKLLPKHVEALAGQVADFHSHIPVAALTSRFGTPDSVAEPMRTNFAHLDLARDEASQRIIRELREWCERELARRRDRFVERKAGGFIRECHGDMHLGNMILENDLVTIFDCIEFNEDLRWIDVLSEVAFCAMDLEDRGRPDLAHRFINAYLEWSGDYGGLSVYPIYWSYRALVRAKVASLRGTQSHVAEEEKRRLLGELHNYLQLAERSTRPRTQFLAITHGVSGSGKTWGSQAIVDRLGAIRLRSDFERKRLAGLDALAATGSGLARDLYSAEFTRRTYECLVDLASAVIRDGFSVLVDATFLERANRERFRSLSEQLTVPFVIVDFPADEATCRQRIRERTRRGNDASEATEEVLEHQLRTQEPLDERERSDTIAIDTNHPESIAAALAKIENRAKRG